MKRHFFATQKHKKPTLLKSKALAFYCLFLIGIQTSFSFLWSAQNQVVLAATQITAEDLFQYTNDERTNVGLPALNYNAKLATAAYNKGVDMFADQYWAHVAPDGTTPWYFILNANYDYHYAGENLAKDFSTASAVVKAWMNSPSHRENIVNKNFEDMGIAVVSGIFEGEETSICVQMFGALIPESTPEPETITPTELNPEPTPTPQPAPQNETPTYTPEVTEPQVEIDKTPPSSPTIKTPKDNTLSNENKPTITGEASEKATITIYDAQNKIGSIPTDDQFAFSFRPETEMNEGEHLLSATATDESDNESDHSETVTFIIDTFPPFIDEDSVSLESFYRFSQKAIKIQVIVLADPQEVVASLSNYSLVLEKRENNEYGGIIVPPEEILSQNTKLKITSHDQAGNQIEVEKTIPDFPENQNTKTDILGIIQINNNTPLQKLIPQNSQDTSRMFFGFFGIGLMGLMTINSVIIEKKKIEVEGTSTLTHAAMLGISLMGVLWGNTGLIESGLNSLR